MNETFFSVPSDPSNVNAVLLWGLNVVRLFQNIKSPGFTAAMTIVSDVCTGIMVPLTMIILWCVNQKRGARLGIVLIISAWLNAFLKSLLMQPRPFTLDASLGLAHELSYGLPSGHAQMSLTLLILLAYWAGDKYKSKKIIIWIAALFLALLVGFSRVYLGVHFPTDLAGGWLAGGLILALFFLGEKRLTLLLERAGKRGQLIVIAASSLIMKFVYPEDTRLGALLLGFAGGYALLVNTFSFSASGTINGKNPSFLILVLRCFLGALGTAVVSLSLKLILPGEGSIFESVSWWGLSSPFIDLGYFIRYGLLGLWISAAAPLLFGNLNLAQIQKNKEA
ncbi:MAG: phosphatase PAP2 family protein [Treponema sp.]|jgi:membrane-associated phospholipid phosphatase|nr:phosphatase PAP2 family protein [Treponema sp.]